MYVCVPHTCMTGTHGYQKKAQSPLKLEVRMVVIYRENLI